MIDPPNQGTVAGVPRLAIVSHVVHYAHGGRLHAYGPFAREMEIWASLFPQIVMVAPVRNEAPPSDTAPLAATNILMRPMPESGGTTLTAKITQALMTPWLLLTVWRHLGDVDAIHVRCPGNVGLLGLFIAPLRSRRLIAKYAGQWGGYDSEPWTLRLQRALLRSSWWRGPVTVYGRREDDPPNVVGFFTSAMDESHLTRARTVARRRRFAPPFSVLYVGRLTPSKRVDAVIEAVSLVEAEVVSRCTIVGDGPERSALEKLAASPAVYGRVSFAGAIPFDQVLEKYESHDVLVLVSDTEGWPKAVAEGLSFGMLVVGSNRGEIRRMLGEQRGVLVEPGDAVAVAECFRHIPELAAQRARAGADALRDEACSCANLHDALRALIIAHW